MYPLTTETAKALLPIANRPMISYQLELLERLGFEDVIIVAQEKAASELKTFVDEIYEGRILVNWVLLQEFMGTAEALLLTQDKIKTDFIVISSDLITDEHFIHKMTDFHRIHDSTATILLYKPQVTDKEQEQLLRQQRIEYGLLDYFGLSTAHDNLLLYMAAAADIEGSMVIPKELLRKYPDLTIHANLIDSHFYIFSRSVIDILLSHERQQNKILSIKGELLPLLISTHNKAPEPTREKSEKTEKSEKEKSNKKIECYALIKETGYSSRANTTKSYLQMNIDMASKNSVYTPWEPTQKNYFLHSTAQVDPKTQIGPECVVGQGTHVGEKCSVKKSIIGKHCKVDARVKIINSVIMDHVTIEPGCVISGSVICNNVYMKEECTIKDSFVGAAYTVPEKTDIKNDTLCQNKGMTML